MTLAALGGLLLWQRPSGAEAELKRYQRRPVRLLWVTADNRLTLHVAAADTPQAEGDGLTVQLAGVRVDPAWRERCRRRIAELCGDQPFSLTFPADLSGTGPTGAYVYLNDGRMLNEHLLRNGLGRSASEDRHPLRPWFARLQRMAISRGRGLWAERENP